MVHLLKHYIDRLYYFIECKERVSVSARDSAVVVSGARVARVGEEVLKIVAFVLGGVETIKTGRCEGMQVFKTNRPSRSWMSVRSPR
jgi:hypothetical protein